jgi:hypothetical protein
LIGSIDDGRIYTPDAWQRRLTAAALLSALAVRSRIAGTRLPIHAIAVWNKAGHCTEEGCVRIYIDEDGMDCDVVTALRRMA